MREIVEYREQVKDLFKKSLGSLISWTHRDEYIELQNKGLCLLRELCAKKAHDSDIMQVVYLLSILDK